jgi:putative colanic acid biosynthesis acetyltransferase WcaF
MHLDRFRVDRGGYTVGAGMPRHILWFFAGAPLVRSWFLPFSPLKVAVLRAFGASIGRGVRIKPGVRVKFPWRLTVGEYSWLGEDLWIDNLDEVRIGAHCCISQGAYLCTGSHDWSSDTFDLITKPIVVEDHAWLGARSVVAPGVTVREGAVLGLGSVATRSLEPWTIYMGTPADAIRQRPRSMEPDAGAPPRSAAGS